MRGVASLGIGLIALLAGARAGAAPADPCLEGAAAPDDRAQIEALRSEIAATCDCLGSDTRNTYLGCVRSLVADAVAAGELRSRCSSSVRSMERASTCGYPSDNPRVVCVEDSGDGKKSVSCSIRRPSTCKTSNGVDRTICSAPGWPYTHCVDAADWNGDLIVAAPHDEGRCAISQAIHQTPSQAQPAETPGTPGVVPSNPKLVVQFGGPDFDLNKGIYSRWRFKGAGQPDAILVAVAGFGGGANNFKPFAENLLSRALRDHGLVVEVWGFHRRSNQLEDRAGSLIALELADPLVALDWYFGAELGLELHPALVAGPNRRAFFYNQTDDVAFLANWTNQVISQDIDVVIDIARSVARNQNVFLGGHSAGTGFTARYAATDFNLGATGPAEPGHAKLRGLVLLEGGGGSANTPPLSEDSLDRIIAKFDGGNFGAVRDGAPRCVDGTTPCTIDSEATDCAGQVPPVCTPSTGAYTSLLPGLGVGVLASSEVIGLQGLSDSDSGQAIIQVDQGAPGNNAVAVVPALAILSILPPSTVHGVVGGFLDDESLGAMFSPAIATSLGALGPFAHGLRTWIDITEGPLPPEVLPNNGPAPTELGGDLRWGQEKEVSRVDRVNAAFVGGGTNQADWYYPISGLGVTSAPGRCTAGVCTAGDVGASCDGDNECNQSISLDSTALSVGRNRPDIANLTQAGGIDIPVLCIGGSNGLTPVPGRYLAFAQSLGPCTAASCDGTPRVLDPDLPNPAFPTFGGVAGGFEVHINEGLAHSDVTFAEDNADTNIYGPLADFLARNLD